MDEDARFDLLEVRLTLERELRLLADAISVVSESSVTSVTLGGLWFGEELLPRARALAAGRGLAVRAIFPLDEHGADLVVEPA